MYEHGISYVLNPEHEIDAVVVVLMRIITVLRHTTIKSFDPSKSLQSSTW